MGWRQMGQAALGTQRKSREGNIRQRPGRRENEPSEWTCREKTLKFISWQVPVRVPSQGGGNPGNRRLEGRAE